MGNKNAWAYYQCNKVSFIRLCDESALDCECIYLTHIPCT